MADATSNNLPSEDLPTKNDMDRMMYLECPAVKSLVDDNVGIDPHRGAAGSSSYDRNPELQNSQEHLPHLQREMSSNLNLGDVTPRTEQSLPTDDAAASQVRYSSTGFVGTDVQKKDITRALGQVILNLHKRLRFRNEKNDVDVWSSDGDQGADELQDSIHLAKLRLKRHSSNPAKGRRG